MILLLVSIFDATAVFAFCNFFCKTENNMFCLIFCLRSCKKLGEESYVVHYTAQTSVQCIITIRSGSTGEKSELSKRWDFWERGRERIPTTKGQAFLGGFFRHWSNCNLPLRKSLSWKGDVYLEAPGALLSHYKHLRWPHRGSLFRPLRIHREGLMVEFHGLIRPRACN